jgi:uncharacterized membrane protein YheB (UPF0754 family)
VNDLLRFAIPPLVGAFIGFVTNVIAIRMLFRPLREIRVFGIRLPFTPGILPRQRKRLAQSIGGMVERELFTPQILRRRLEQESLREQFYAAVSAFTARLFASPPAVVTGAHAASFAEQIAAEAEKHYGGAAAALVSMMRRPDTHRELEIRGRLFLNRAVLQLNVFQRLFVSAARYDTTLEERMPFIIDDLIDEVEKLLADEVLRRRLRERAVSVLEAAFAEREKKLGELLGITEEAKEKLDALLCERLLAAADSQMERILASLNVREMVAQRIDSLDMIRLERIILDVMADQLKWIDFFGAVLGFVIGLFQVLFARFAP